MILTILFARAWDFEDKKTGRQVQGMELVGVPLPSSDRQLQDNQKGVKPITLKGKFSCFASIPADLDARPVRMEIETDVREYEGNTTLYVTRISPVSSVPK